MSDEINRNIEVETQLLGKHIEKLGNAMGLPQSLQGAEFFCEPCNFPFIVSVRFSSAKLNCPKCRRMAIHRPKQQLISISLW